MSERWFTWANLFTATRLAVLPAFVTAILFADWLIAAALFTCAALSDYFDGKLARAYGQSSAAGGLFDHASDAVFVSCGCAALAAAGLINPFLSALIAIAFLQYMFDSKALAGRHLRMSLLGRNNGVAYFVLVGTAVGAALFDWGWLQAVVAIGGWGLVVSTLASMGDRLWTLLRQPG